ncbi:MAG: 50S ribosomal protein L11 methyltransferase [Rhodospirillaceae bacterium]|nr:50S ribosomal protein L11 methyltransferase [Rhodospirillaceae bacterium]
MNSNLTRIAITIPDSAIEIFENALQPFVQSLLWSVDDSTHMQVMEGFADITPDSALLNDAIKRAASIGGIEVPKIIIEQIPERDWVAENLKQFPPISVGRFFIYGAHIDLRPLPGQIPIRIDQSVAFGTGSHATTAGCLLAIGALGKAMKPKCILDMGTGSGILALAMIKLWQKKVIATDIDEKAVGVARKNGELNGVAKKLICKSGKGFAALNSNANKLRYKKFDLITANILARPLAAMSGDLAGALAPGGRAILSGLITRDEKMVLNAHRRYGLFLEKRIVIDDWLTLVLKKG